MTLDLLTMLWEFCFRDLRQWVLRNESLSCAFGFGRPLLFFSFGYLIISDYMKFGIFYLTLDSVGHEYRITQKCSESLMKMQAFDDIFARPV